MVIAANRGAGLRNQSKRHGEAIVPVFIGGGAPANLKFLSVLPQVRHRNFKFKAALESMSC
jgi:hypothetical protein